MSNHVKTTLIAGKGASGKTRMARELRPAMVAASSKCFSGMK